MELGKKIFCGNFFTGSSRIIFHIGVAALSAAIALSLPWIVNLLAQKVLTYWSIIGNEKIFLLSVEMALAILLTLCFNYINRSWKNRKLSRMARSAGLIFVTSAKGHFQRRKIKRWKEKQGFAKDIMVMGSTGFQTFVDPKSDLHQVIQNCRKAKIMLIHPYSEVANLRVKSLFGPNITPENFVEQIKKSVDFLKEIQTVKKNIKLKLYSDLPLLKLTILDDHIWMQHYHAGFDIQSMPEYLFKYDQNFGSLFITFYQYFLTKWSDPATPEYDFDMDELIYRDTSGNEVKREKIDQMESETFLQTVHRDHQVLSGANFRKEMVQNYGTHPSIENLYKTIG